MRNREIENRLRRETESILPDVCGKVAERGRIDVGPSPEPPRPDRREFLAKRLLPAVAVACAAILIVVLGVVLWTDPVPASTFLTVEVCGDSPGEAVAAAAGTAVSGPSISLTADSRNVIDSVRADNESGIVVLKDSEIRDGSVARTVLTGMRLREGAGLIASVFVKLGYVNGGKDVYVRVTVAGEKEKKAGRLGEAVSKEMERRFKRENVSADVKTGVYEKEELRKLAEECGIKPGDTIAEITAELAERKDFVAEKVDRLKEAAQEKARDEKDAVLDAVKDHLQKDIEDRIEESEGETKESLEELKERLEEEGPPDEEKSRLKEFLKSLGLDVAYVETGSFEIPETFDQLAEFLEKAAEKRAEELAEKNEKPEEDTAGSRRGRNRRDDSGKH